MCHLILKCVYFLALRDNSTISLATSLPIMQILLSLVRSPSKEPGTLLVEALNLRLQ